MMRVTLICTRIGLLGRRNGRSSLGKLRARKRRTLTGRDLSAAVMLCISKTGTRRVIRMKISRRLSPSGLPPGWMALQKLEYVDELMRSLAGKPPVHMPEYRVADYDCLNVKLKTYYARKRKLYEDTYPDFYDADLRQLFGAPAGIKASMYLQRRRRRILNAVCQWTNENKFRVNQLLSRLTRRCDQLGLHVLNDDPQQDFRVSAFITTLVINYLFTGKFKRTK